MKPDGAFLEELSEAVMVGDGAVGTNLLAQAEAAGRGIEMLNLDAPLHVARLHRDYVEAGSRLIETNTFAANRPALARRNAEGRMRDILAAGVTLARRAADGRAWVAGSLGPLPLVDGEPIAPSEQARLFREQIEVLLDGNVDAILFETFISVPDLVRAIREARSLTRRPVIAQLAFERNGTTPDGIPASVAFRHCRNAGADVTGANCGDGLPAVLAALDGVGDTPGPFSAFVNAGYADRIEERRVYGAASEYLAQRSGDLIDRGARLIGGCCGTGPDFIRRLCLHLSERPRPRPPLRTPSRPASVSPPRRPETPPPPPDLPDRLVVELDPPRELTLESLRKAGAQLSARGVRTVTVADNPLALPGVDNLAAAGVLSREFGLDVIPHLTGRDRNRIALQSSLMGAHCLGIRSVLCVTGDPVRRYHESNTSGVFDVTSVTLVQLANAFNQGQRSPGGLRTRFAIGVAINPNVRTLSGQIEHLKRKVDAGAHFALTQPIFDPERFESLCEALAAAGVDLPLYAGLLPLTSTRNADFLNNEVPGIRIPAPLLKMLHAHPQLEDQRRIAQEHARRTLESLARFTGRFYLIAPRNRVEFVLPLVDTVARNARSTA